MHTHVYHSIIHKSQDINNANTHQLRTRWIKCGADTQWMLFSQKKAGNPAVCGPWGYLKSSKSDRDSQILGGITYMWNLKKSNSWKEWSEIMAQPETRGRRGQVLEFRESQDSPLERGAVRIDGWMDRRVATNMVLKLHKQQSPSCRRWLRAVGVGAFVSVTTYSH